MNALKNGTKVKTVYGNWITVAKVSTNIVWYYESSIDTIHITKLLISTAK